MSPASGRNQLHKRRKTEMPDSSRELIVLPSAAPEISESYSAADEEISRAITSAQENLLRQQNADGHWCGELIVDSTLCSDYVVFMHWCGEVDAQLQRRCVRHILKRQLPDGGWNIYHGGPSEINASVKAYFALKLAGCSVDAPFMRDARANIISSRGNICPRSLWKWFSSHAGRRSTFTKCHPGAAPCSCRWRS